MVEYFWDFAYNDTLIIVQSNHFNGKIFGTFPASQVGVDNANRLISELKRQKISEGPL